MKNKYKKTQYIDWNSWIIDTPGEYVENKNLSCALGLYAYEADVVGLLLSADDSFSVYSPNMTGLVNREVIGIVTKSDLDNPIKAKEWLKLAGCERIFVVNSINGDGIEQLINYLSE